MMKNLWMIYLDLFRELDKRAPDKAAPVVQQPRSVISIEAYVTSVERLAKAIRG